MISITAMDLSRRELSLLAPLLALQAQGQQQSAPLTSKVYHPDSDVQLVNVSKKGGRIFLGSEHSGFELEMHQTILGPGVESHAPHRHVHEEIIVVLQGTVETYIDGKTEVAGPGSIIYFGSNQLHKSQNVGQEPSRYYVLELRGRAA